MKNVIINPWMEFYFIVLLILLLTQCNKGKSDDKPFGKLEISVGIAVAADDIYNDLKAANTDDFKVIIYDSEGAIVASFDRLADMPDIIELPEGTYHVVAHSDNNLPAVFENPYYYGLSENFTVTAGNTSSVSITCTLANIMISVIYSDNVVQYFNDYSATVSNPGGALLFDKDETRAGYFNGGPLHIEANLYYTDGQGVLQTISLTGNINNPEPRKHYEIHIDASVTNGYTMINLNVDEGFETEIITINNEDAPGEVLYGDLIISEIMYNPKALSDSKGEWIELHNVSAKTLNLKDLLIRRSSAGDFHKISADILLSPDDYAVFARADSAVLNPDYVTSYISLNNSGDEITISTFGTNGTDGTVICSVDYGAAGFDIGLNGASLQLDPLITNVEETKIGTNWCAANILYSTGDYGTPGSTNTDCQ
jgi:hypothetical protein